MIAKRIVFSLLGMATALLSGCAEFTHLTRTRTAPGMQLQTNYIDAKQRVVMTQLEKETIPGTHQERQFSTFCTEPSPDAVSAIAASQGFSLKKGNIDATFNNALAESAASIGLRTQSIQLMRDAMYRLCEARMSGYIDDLAFETLHRRFQSSMVAILAIEQLTGAVRAPTVVLSSGSESGSADMVAKYTDLASSRKSVWDNATAARKAKEDKVPGIQAELDKVRADAKLPTSELGAEESPAEKTNIEKKQKALDDDKADVETAKTAEGNAKSAYDSAESARLSALSGGGTAKASAEFEVVQRTTLSDAAAASVARSVQAIVEDTLKLSFTRELCTTILLASARGQLGPIGPIGDGADRKKLQASLIEAQAAHIQAEALQGRIGAENNKQKKDDLEKLLKEQTTAEKTAIAEYYKLSALNPDALVESNAALALKSAAGVTDQCSKYLEKTVASFDEQARAGAAFSNAGAELLKEVAKSIAANPGAYSGEAVAKLTELIRSLQPQANAGDATWLSLDLSRPVD